MFLVRTTRACWSTASAKEALAQANALSKAGHTVVVERLGCRSLTLDDLQRTRGTGHLFVSHDPDVIAHVSDRVLRLEGGGLLPA